MKKLIAFIFVLAAIITINSCRRDNYIVICYDNDIEPILIRSCATPACHSAGGKTGGYVFTAYEGVFQAVTPGNANTSKLYKVIKGAHPTMPKEGGKLSRREVSLIKSWIDFGASDCGSAGTATVSNCDTTSVTYNTHVKAIMDGFCISCHFNGNPTGHTLDTYIGVKNSILSGLLIPSIKHQSANPMPQGGSKLSDCNIRKVEIWIQAGMPQ